MGLEKIEGKLNVELRKNGNKKTKKKLMIRI